MSNGYFFWEPVSYTHLFTGGVDDVWGNSGADMGNGLSDINPEDIESMTVLKGA